MASTVYFFWLCLFLVIYTYIGYGMLLWVLVKIKEAFVREKTKQSFAELPEVTLFITAYNEEAVVDEKMENMLGLDYPKEKLHVLWVTDGSTDRTVDKLKRYQDIEILHQPERRGKTAAMNRGMRFVKTPVTVFTDANTMINREAIIQIIEQFGNDRVGCVAGEKRIFNRAKESAVGGEGVYWKYESTLKALDSRLYTAVGAAGELFAIRTSLYEEMPSDTLLDDFILSMRIAQKGYKIAYCKEAYAVERASKNILEEEKRKVRISAGGLQSVIRLRSLLNPFRYGWLSFQYISHRVLRWTITPLALFFLLPLNIWLVVQGNEPSWLYKLVFVLQLCFYSAALLGCRFAHKSIRHKLFFIPYYFLFMNLSVFKGFLYFWRRKNQPAIWEKAERF